MSRSLTFSLFVLVCFMSFISGYLTSYKPYSNKMILLAKKPVAEPIVSKVKEVKKPIEVEKVEVVEEKGKKVLSKSDLISLLRDKTEFTKSGIEALLNAFSEIVSEEVLVSGKEIRIRDFGTFKQRVSQPRKGRNPKTGEELQISGSKSVSFTASSALKVKTEES